MNAFYSALALAVIFFGYYVYDTQFREESEPEVTNRATIECPLGRDLQIIHDGGTKATIVCNNEN